MPSHIPRVTVALAAKPWWRSRTLWLNALVLALAAAEAQVGVLQPWLPVNVFALIAFCLPVANALLRFATVQAVAMSSLPGPSLTDAGRAP